jgi:indolepyruvate ferredoxin oxidoreductase beta subunit
VKFAGLGGEGVIRASDILAEVAFRAGMDVKKSELHGMSQRGGSVSADVRFSERVWSPMIPEGEADYLVVISSDQVDNNLPALKKGGVLLRPEMIDKNALPNKKSLNVALLGALSKLLPLPEAVWLDTLHEAFQPEFFPNNEKAFQLGRSAKPT